MPNYNAYQLDDINELRRKLAASESENARLRAEIGKANAYLGGRNARKARVAKVASASRFWMRRAQDLEKRMRRAGLPVSPVANPSDGTEGMSANDW